MDRLSRERRSRNMAAIRSINTSPELIVRKMLHRLGFRFRLHAKNLPGKPDIVLRRYGSVILVHGCFWHAHCCVDGHLPKSNQAYWVKKRQSNRARDLRNRRALRRLGWRVLVVWECETVVRRSAWLSARLERFLLSGEKDIPKSHHSQGREGGSIQQERLGVMQAGHEFVEAIRD